MAVQPHQMSPRRLTDSAHLELLLESRHVGVRLSMMQWAALGRPCQRYWSSTRCRWLGYACVQWRGSCDGHNVYSSRGDVRGDAAAVGGRRGRRRSTSAVRRCFRPRFFWRLRHLSSLSASHLLLHSLNAFTHFSLRAPPRPRPEAERAAGPQCLASFGPFPWALASHAMREALPVVGCSSPCSCPPARSRDG
jgi:hypothetical protein